MTIGPSGSATVDLSAKVPAGVTAVAVNVTLSGVTARTFVSVCPTTTPLEKCRRTSTVNPYPGRDVANLAFPRVGADRGLRIYNNEGSVLASVDLVGYFTTTPGTRADFAPVTPQRQATVLNRGGATSGTVPIADVPAGATAVAVRVTAAGVTANTYLSACPAAATDEDCERSSTLNPNRRDTSNMAVVPISPGTGSTIKIFNNVGDAIVYTDVTGFFVPAGQGSRYVAVAPTRVQSMQPIESQILARQYPSLPAGSTGVAANITVAGASDTTFVSVCPGGTTDATCRRTSTVNPYAGQDTASGTLTGVGEGGSLVYVNNVGAALLITDIQGYFIDS